MRGGPKAIKVIPTWDGRRREPGSEPVGRGEGGQYAQAALCLKQSELSELHWVLFLFCFYFIWF